ncbi:MAG: Rha family transcriptional regulator [Campylobacter sp.]|uniref:Rha family transcriptional regulator n=1 Tax=Campylobacter sp. TaxID=205 RepID=UPI001B0F895F|nr:Rha family transcriptional regulator [Campylobacter sp.]MBO7155394.1 Rha family transcriptional regulator [Campylobacter sp.]
MNEIIVINGQSVEFEVVNSGIFTTSLSVANVFNKRHSDILAQIREFPKDDFTERNFPLSEYTDSTGRKLPCYNLTRDGFSLLVMGFTGARAYKWKIEFIEAFNKMEAMIKAAKNSDLNLQSKFTEILSALKEKSNEADVYKAKYYESLERENSLLRDRLMFKSQNLQKSTRLSESEKENIISLYKSGLSQAEICRKTSRSDTAVRNAIRSAL